jgi:hypothetical protein
LMMVGGFFGVFWASAVAAEASTINIVARSWDRMGCLSRNSDADRSPRNTSVAGLVQLHVDLAAANHRHDPQPLLPAQPLFA